MSIWIDEKPSHLNGAMCWRHVVSAVAAVILLIFFGPGRMEAADGMNFQARVIPGPLPGHPGNIFLAGEEVVFSLPGKWAGSWRVLDYEGKQVAAGAEPGKINLGRLPVGYYQIQHEDGKLPIGIGVLSPLLAPTPTTSPIGVDTAVPWSLRNKLPEAASFCALAGMNWARGRISWKDMELKQGEFATANQYDAAASEMDKAGIQLLFTCHMTPEWAGGVGEEKRRFPANLLDAYSFFREMARRWKGRVQAFEPWNEADWEAFGGHSGAEMASYQKACYLGLKAGNPDVIVAQHPFANCLSEVIADFRENRVWPYFDTLNVHHYRGYDKAVGEFGVFREISGGRPIWLSEGGFYDKTSDKTMGVDPETGEFTAEGLKMRAAQVLHVLAISIQNGSTASLWFLLPNYRERETLFGVLRADLTPRPAYLSLAAAGRLLADARPVGRLKTVNKNYWGCLFRAKPDGREKLVLLAWCMKDTETIKLPTEPDAVYDTIGREQKPGGTALEIARAPVFCLFPVDLQTRFDYEPAPVMPPRVEEKPSPVVLQACWPPGKSTSAHPNLPGLFSHYWIGSNGLERMPVFVYNFGDKEVKGRMTVTGPGDWQLGIPKEVTVKPMERVPLDLTYDLSQTRHRTRGVVKIEGDFGQAGKTILSLRLLPLLPASPRVVRDMPAFMVAGRWTAASRKTPAISITAVPEGIQVEVDCDQSDQKEFNVSLNITPEERPSETENALLLPVKIVEGEVNSLAVRFTEENGCASSSRYGMGERAKNDDGAISLGTAATSWTRDPQQLLDPRQLRSLQINGEVKTQKLKFIITKAGWATF